MHSTQFFVNFFVAENRCIIFVDGTTLAKGEEFKSRYPGLGFESQLSLNQNGTNFPPLLGFTTSLHVFRHPDLVSDQLILFCPPLRLFILAFPLLMYCTVPMCVSVCKNACLHRFVFVCVCVGGGSTAHRSIVVCKCPMSVLSHVPYCHMFCTISVFTTSHVCNVCLCLYGPP